MYQLLYNHSFVLVTIIQLGFCLGFFYVEVQCCAWVSYAGYSLRGITNAPMGLAPSGN